MPHWKRNLLVLCGAQFLTMIGFSSYIPFVPFYVQEMGVVSQQQVLSWVAAFNSGAALAMMLFSPMWGGLADRVGRKVMLVRATLAASVLAFLMGQVTSPEQLIALRVLQGALCGTVGAAVTLVVTETPEQHMGRSLGAMQTAQFAGQSLGPLLGGFGADLLGYRAVFPISSAVMFVSFVSVTALVREKARPARSAGKRPRTRLLSRRAMASVFSRNTLVLLLALAANSFAMAVIQPVLSLYVQSLTPDATHLGTLAGSVISVAALTCSLSAVGIGRLGDKFGQKRILTACVAGMALIHVPQALVNTPMQLLVLRAIQGLFMGGVLPTTNALLARSTAQSRRGTVFGFSISGQAGGRAVGPLAGAGVAAAWGMPSSFLITALVFAAISGLVLAFVDPHAVPVEEPSEAEPKTQQAPAEGESVRAPSASTSGPAL